MPATDIGRVAATPVGSPGRTPTPERLSGLSGGRSCRGVRALACDVDALLMRQTSGCLGSGIALGVALDLGWLF